MTAYNDNSQCEAHVLILGEPCKNAPVLWGNCRAYGMRWLCSSHSHIATRCCQEADAAEREGGMTLAQQLKDERAMTR